jgi:hypothetical protein
MVLNIDHIADAHPGNGAIELRNAGNDVCEFQCPR